MKVKKLFNDISINEKQFLKWMQALRSGEYKQTQGALNDYQGYCCLGAAVKCLLPSYSIELTEDGYISGAMPSCQKHSPKWLVWIDKDFHCRMPSTVEAVNTPWFEGRLNSTPHLTVLNDSGKMSFDDIADVLEAIYVHGVLED